MIDLTNKTVLVYDLSGAFTHIAESIVPDFGRVLYSSQWETGFSNIEDFLPGVGLEGIERVTDPFEHFQDCDLIIFPDVGMDGLQEYLRDQGLAVWGSGSAGRLERDRVYLKQRIEEQGMDVANYEVIRGLTALREYLAENEDVYVKISYFRGLAETFHHVEGFLSRRWLDELALKLGLYADQIIFLVEQAIEGDAVEVGIDSYAVNGVFPSRVMWGYECKDAGYIGTTADLPGRLRRNMLAFEPVLREFTYRGPYSNEIRVTEDGKDYLIDVTARMPSPPSEILCKNITNFAEVMYQGARGILLQPDYAYRFGAQLVLKSEQLDEGHGLAVRIGMPENVLLHGHCRLEGEDYVISPSKIAEFGGAIGLGDTLSEAVSIALEAAESVTGYQVTFQEDALDKVMECIEKGEKLQLSWGEFTEEVEYDAA